MKEFTWEELEKHNNMNSAYVAYDEKVYDVTKWVSDQ
jgi:predicted heme/steroid binding protein